MDWFRFQITVLVLILAPKPALALKIPEEIKGAVVAVGIYKGDTIEYNGSGIVFAHSGQPGECYLVTARHILDAPPPMRTREPKQIFLRTLVEESNFRIYPLTLRETEPARNVFYAPAKLDLAAISLPTSVLDLLKLIPLPIGEIPSIADWPEIGLSPGAVVFYVTRGKDATSDTMVPSIVQGRLLSVPRDLPAYLILDVQSWSGTSGSPVFCFRENPQNQPDQSEVILLGILVGARPIKRPLTQTLAIKSPFAAELLERAMISD